MVYDPTVSPGCNWSDEHYAQGFVRREGVVCFRTLLQYGKAQVEIVRGRYVASDFARVIRCPLQLVSDSVWVVGPEEWPERRSPSSRREKLHEWSAEPEPEN